MTPRCSTPNYAQFTGSQRDPRPSDPYSLSLFETEGAGNAGRWPQPMARLQKKTQAAVTTGSAEHPAFPARWS
jgi:hypothetical protein